MYTLVSALGNPVQAFGRWEPIDVADVPLMTLYRQYRKFLLLLKTPFTQQNVTLDMDRMASQLAGSPKTVAEFLTDNGETTLPTTVGTTSLSTGVVQYIDAFDSGYSVKLADGITPISDDYLDTKKWLYLQKPGIDYQKFYEHVMVSINGFYHRTDFDPNGAYVVNAVKSRDVSGCATVGLVNFERIGKLKYYSITKEMLYKQGGDTPYKDVVCVDLGTSHANKTLVVVIGGYMHICDPKIIYRMSETTFAIRFNQINFLNRFLESRQYLDMTDLGLDVYHNNDTKVNVGQLTSDEVIERYMTMEQSFVVLIDNPNIYTDKIPVMNHSAPGVYTSGIKPDLPMVLGYGRLANHIWKPYHLRYDIRALNGVKDNYIFNTTDWTETPNIDDKRIPAYPTVGTRFSNANFLKIQADLLTVS